MEKSKLFNKSLKSKIVMIIMFINFLIFTIILLPNISLAFSNATIDFDGYGSIGTIEVLSLQQGANEPDSVATGASRRRGEVEMGDLFVLIPLDENFPNLFLSIASGRVLPEVVLNMDDGLISIKLTNALLVSVELSDRLDQAGTLSIRLNYEEIDWTYGDVTAHWKREKGE